MFFSYPHSGKDEYVQAHWSYWIRKALCVKKQEKNIQTTSKIENNCDVWGNCNRKIIFTDKWANGSLKLQKLLLRPEHCGESWNSFGFFFSFSVNTLFSSAHSSKHKQLRKRYEDYRAMGTGDVMQRVFCSESGNWGSGLPLAIICSVHR